MKTKKERARTISPRIKESTRQALAEAYGNANAGAQRALRSWIPLREATRKDLFDFFTEADLRVITLAYSDAKFYPEFALNLDAMTIRVEVALRDVDVPGFTEQLTEKIEQLTPAERFFLVELVMAR